jgi:hypothetical protein
MTSRQDLDRVRAPAAATARDAAVRRMSRINRLVAGGSAVMVAGFAILAAQASSHGTASTTANTPAPASATTAGTSSGSGSTATSSYGTSPWQATSDQTAAPAATQQAPVITSGGS